MKKDIFNNLSYIDAYKFIIELCNVKCYYDFNQYFVQTIDFYPVCYIIVSQVSRGARYFCIRSYNKVS